MKFKQWDWCNGDGQWLADSTLPRSYTKTDESMICLVDIQLWTEHNTQIKSDSYISERLG